MTSADSVFSGAIPALYDRHLGVGLFGPYAERIAASLSDLRVGDLLEVAAGTGIVTTVLAQTLPSTVVITATDLNGPMLDRAAAKPGLEQVTFRQADALALPFPEASFDAVVCQFGVMFFPDRARAHAEAARVLKPGGRYVFNVWDSLQANPASEEVERAVAALYPAQPPGFLGRTPYAYYQEDRIRSDLRNAGWEDCTVQSVEAVWRSCSPMDPAIALCQGTPLRNEIEAIDPDGLGRATEAAGQAIKARFGADATSFPTRALQVEARR